MYYYSAVLLALSYELLRRRKFPDAKPYEIAPGDGSLRALSLAVCSLVFLVGARSALIYRAAHDPQAPAWYSHIPVASVTNDAVFWTHPYREMLSALLALIDIAGSLALYLLYRTLRTRGVKKIDWFILVSAYAVAVAVTAFTPAFSVVDPYDYVGYGKLGFHAYSSHALSFPCERTQGEVWCQTPAPPSMYGPLFLAYAHALFGPIEPTSASFAILRITNICWVAMLPLLLFFLKTEPALIAVAALNPMILAQYVGDAHNDIIGVDCMLAGVLLARRFPFLTLLLCTAASLVKIPFALIGALAFLPLAPRTRLAWGIASILTSAIASFLCGGRPYIETLLSQNKNVHFFAQADHWLVALIVVGLITAALTRNRISLPGAYAIPALAGFFAFSWYALWALPYILNDRAKRAIFLIALPATSFLMEPAFQIPMLWNIVIITATVVTLIQFGDLLPRRNPRR